MALPDTEGDLPGWVLGSLLLAGTISLAGITDYLLTNAGFETLGTFVWALCYTAALLTIWFVWLRDIELQGPTSG